jgi:hypothetical protein
MITGVELSRRIGRLFRRIYTERPVGTIEDWARVNIWLSSEESADFPGFYDPDLNPLPTVLFWAYRSGKYKKAVFKKSSQSGVTLAVLVLICWYVVHEVRNFLYVLDSIDEMRDVSKHRLKPMLVRCKAAEGRVPEDEDKMSNLTLKLLGCIGYLRGANSIGGLSNKSTGLNIYDEVDAHPTVKGTNEKAVELAKERGKAQSKFFEVLLSKPIEWDGTINQEFLKGTQHKCFVPCPHCGSMQELEWEQVKFGHCKVKGKWDFELLKTDTYYQCKFQASDRCRELGGRIDEHHKPDLLAGREWRQTNFGKGDQDLNEETFSCEITDLYSRRKGSLWADLAREWIESQGDTSKMQNFLRGRLARPRKNKQVEIVTHDIFRMTKDYLSGHCPVEPDLIIIASDVQQVPPEKKWVKAAFRLDDDSCHVIEWGRTLAFGDLITEFDRPVHVDQWDRFTPVAERIDPRCRVGFIDERHERDQVRNFVVSSLLGEDTTGMPVYRYYPVRGWGGMHTRRMTSIVTPVLGAKPNAEHQGWPLWVYDLDDDAFKNQLYNERINGYRKALAAIAAGQPMPPGWPPLWFPRDIDPAFVSELCQEKFRKNPRTGFWEWEDPKGDNDWGDALKYCLVGWYLMRPIIAAEKARRNAERLARAA